MIIKLANSIQTMHDDEEYFNHVPGTAKAGTMVGTVGGVAGGILGGHVLSKTPYRIQALADANPGVKNAVNAGLKYGGFKHTDITKVLPSKKKLFAGAAIGGGVYGALDGAYSGSMIGTGMNDRQYLLQKNIPVQDVIKNSTMASVQMNSSGNKISNMKAESFGGIVGMLHRNKFRNMRDGSLQEHSENK